MATSTTNKDFTFIDSHGTEIFVPTGTRVSWDLTGPYDEAVYVVVFEDVGGPYLWEESMLDLIYTYADVDVDSDEDGYDDSMDGDHESALASCGWGTDEDYGGYGGGEDDF